MNIFYLDSDPKKCAEYHCDKHVVKMIVESCQLLSNALPEDEAPYRRTHYNHPCSKWVRESWHNWWWLAQLTECLLYEWRTRYNHDHNHEHACAKKLLEMVVHVNYHNPASCTPKTPPPQCMPEDCKCNDTVEAYRKYYMQEKRGFATWKNQQPKWFK